MFRSDTKFPKPPQFFPNAWPRLFSDTLAHLWPKCTCHNFTQMYQTWICSEALLLALSQIHTRIISTKISFFKFQNFWSPVIPVWNFQIWFWEGRTWFGCQEFSLTDNHFNYLVKLFSLQLLQYLWADFPTIVLEELDCIFFNF